MKYIIAGLTAVCIAIMFQCCNRKPMSIIPISPYQYKTSFTEDDTTILFTYAIANFSNTNGNMSILDSFVLTKLPANYLRDNQGILFIFYKYEKGKIDENFRHMEQPKQKNLFMESEATSLVQYEWSDGKFISVSLYNKKGHYSKSENRNW